MSRASSLSGSGDLIPRPGEATPLMEVVEDIGAGADAASDLVDLLIRRSALVAELAKRIRLPSDQRTRVVADAAIAFIGENLEVVQRHVAELEEIKRRLERLEKACKLLCAGRLPA